MIGACIVTAMVALVAGTVFGCHVRSLRIADLEEHIRWLYERNEKLRRENDDMLYGFIEAETCERPDDADWWKVGARPPWETEEDDG